jgi:hypothetical protein
VRTAAAVGSSALAKTVKVAGVADLRTAATARMLQEAEA